MSSIGVAGACCRRAETCSQDVEAGGDGQTPQGGG